ncbi:MAG: 2,5-diamino-6-(ribosylamino)-4(3H)-pyrimidinone 5'-phosphate reductase [Candidatus Bathyarchaeota archaeon]|nr:2,5-diamino-6-(ribosylamino)-4(3H)-pyrimidinone 5'-phosphate reductase [Candidatus Bathyarchaeota archaeon]
MKEIVRPYVIIGGNMSIDGKIAPKDGGGSSLSQFMNNELVSRLHKLRSEVDAIVIGVNTIITNNPLLTVRAVKGKNPSRIVFDSEARTPLNSNIFSSEAKTIVFTSQKASPDRIESIKKLGADVLICGDSKVDIKSALGKIHEMGLKRILVEGGGKIRWSFFKIGAVDEIFLYLSPIVIGGSDTPTFADGLGFESFEDGTRFKLKEFEKIDDVLFLRYLAI